MKFEFGGQIEYLFRQGEQTFEPGGPLSRNALDCQSIVHLEVTAIPWGILFDWM